MKTITAVELRNSLTFNKKLTDENIDDKEVIERGDPLFEECFESWMSNCVSEEWSDDNKTVECFPEDSDEPFCMTLEEYRKI